MTNQPPRRDVEYQQERDFYARRENQTTQGPPRRRRKTSTAGDRCADVPDETSRVADDDDLCPDGS
jgi:hypothetical protein